MLVFVSSACLAVVDACNKVIFILFCISRTFRIVKLCCTIDKHAKRNLMLQRRFCQHAALLLVTVVSKSRFCSTAPGKHSYNNSFVPDLYSHCTCVQKYLPQHNLEQQGG